jgi:hypothetical protein
LDALLADAALRERVACPIRTIFKEDRLGLMSDGSRVNKSATAPFPVCHCNGALPIRAGFAAALPRDPSEGIDLFASGRKALIDDMRNYVQARRLPVLVVLIPSQKTAVREKVPAKGHIERAKAFAAALGGTFLDGGEIFSGVSPEEARNYFFPRHVHWNQNGSDRFADFIVKNLTFMQRPLQVGP